MTFTREGDQITVQMNVDDWEQLLVYLGITAGFFYHGEDKALFWRCIEFANRLNAGNPGFTPYEIHPPGHGP